MSAYYGTNGDDTMFYGNNDSVFGYEGQDKLSGGFMMGGLGNDTYYVNKDTDVVFEVASGGNVDVVRSHILEYTLAPNIEHLILAEDDPASPIGRSYALIGNGNEQDNMIIGNSYFNTLRGHDGDDALYGYGGNDNLYGGAGNDFLKGASTNTMGVGEIDELTGGGNSDVFILGDTFGGQNRVYYSDGRPMNSGHGDYALIKDFTISSDWIRLSGSASNYVLKQSPISVGSGAADTAIYLKSSSKVLGVRNELIGIVQDVAVNQLNLNTNSFEFVSW